jgi:hypothetical protein
MRFEELEIRVLLLSRVLQESAFTRPGCSESVPFDSSWTICDYLLLISCEIVLLRF